MGEKRLHVRIVQAAIRDLHRCVLIKVVKGRGLWIVAYPRGMSFLSDQHSRKRATQEHLTILLTLVSTIHIRKIDASKRGPARAQVLRQILLLLRRRQA